MTPCQNDTVKFAEDGLLYVADTGGQMLRSINVLRNTVTTLAGKGAEAGFVCVLQRVAACCSVVHCGALWCTVAQCGAVWYRVLQRGAE